MNPSREALHALVERSPACVAAHDRTGWLALFAADAFIEDPVGSPPAAKADGTLGRFYDTFIAPHAIQFVILGDHYLGRDVFRDAIIKTRVRPGVEVEVAAYLLYQSTEEGGALRVRRMAAHWQLLQMSAVAMGLGPRAWLAMTGLFARMVSTMGMGWVGGYLASLVRGIGRRGVQAATALAQAMKARDSAAVCALFGDSRDGTAIELGPRQVAPEQLTAALPAGCQLVIEAPVAAGWTTTFRFRLAGGEPAAGLCHLEFEPRTQRIKRARFFPA